MKKYVVLEKPVGQTPLETAEAWRSTAGTEYQNVPLAYAGRLDPMASGKLLVLIGNECKRQTNYHSLDKGYTFSVLFGVKTDTADPLGIIQTTSTPTVTERDLAPVLRSLHGTITLPYPHFSSKTVQGKPLHTWSVEGRLDEITIPTKTSHLYSLSLQDIIIKTGKDIYEEVSEKIESVTPVTDPRKALGNDFRRPDVRRSWQTFHEQYRDERFSIATIRCISSSGTYMRTLAEIIAERINTDGLAYHIERTDIGQFWQLPFSQAGLWLQRYR